MKTGADFRREFPEVDQSFTAAAEKALSAIEEPGRAGRRLRSRAAVLMAAAVLLAVSTAIAAETVRKRAEDFIEENPFSNMNIQADAALSSAFEADVLDMPCASFRVGQAVYDGMAVYLLLEATPKEAGWMIVPGFIQENGQAFSHGSGYPADTTITEYAARQGYAGVLPVTVFGEEITACYYDSAMNEDGSCSLMVWAFVRPEYRELDRLTLHLRVEDVRDAIVSADATLKWEIALPLAGEVHRAVSTEAAPVDLDGAGIAINSVTAVRTAMTTYIITDFDVTDAARYQQSLFYSGGLKYLDEAGEPLKKGTHPLSLVVGKPVQHMGDRTQHITNREMDADCGQVTISVQDGGSHTFYLK